MTRRGWSNRTNPLPGVKCANPECGHAMTQHNDLDYCESPTISRAARRARGNPTWHDGCHCTHFETPEPGGSAR